MTVASRTDLHGRPRPRRLVISSGAEHIEQVCRRGSYIKLGNPAGRTAMFPVDAEIARGTMQSTMRQTDLALEEFEKLA